MCMLCDDEKAYQAYMNYLDAVQRGKGADVDKAIDAVRAAMTGNKAELPDTTLSVHYPSAPASDVAVPPAPRSRFSCDPVDE